MSLIAHSLLPFKIFQHLYSSSRSVAAQSIRPPSNRKLWVPDSATQENKKKRRTRRGKRGGNRKPLMNNQVSSGPNKAQTKAKKPKSVSHPDNVVSLDCEMVGVGDGGHRSILARVAIVDWDGNVLLDTFVKPTEPVTDYRTFVSGVRPEDIHSADAMDFEKCRSLVRCLVANKILCGHAIYNDLEVLRYTHPWFLIRDSAAYEPFLKHGYRPKRLKDLANEFLGIDIQIEGGEHCPVEDARAVMEIYKNIQHEWDFSTKWRQSRAVLCRPLRQLHWD
jgi:RNA exonuclease 4